MKRCKAYGSGHRAVKIFCLVDSENPNHKQVGVIEEFTDSMQCVTVKAMIKDIRHFLDEHGYTPRKVVIITPNGELKGEDDI